MKPWQKVGRTANPSAIAATHIAEIEARARLVRSHSPETEKAALEAIQQSVELADTLPISGPAFFLTARERKAAALLAAGKAEEALEQYERVVDARPNRALSLLGAARAAQAAGDAARAQARYAVLAELWGDADAPLPALAEARAGSHSERRAAARPSNGN